MFLGIQLQEERTMQETSKPINLLYVCFCLLLIQGTWIAHAFPLRHEDNIFISMECIYMYTSVWLFDSSSVNFLETKKIHLRLFFFPAVIFFLQSVLLCFS